MHQFNPAGTEKPGPLSTGRIDQQHSTCRIDLKEVSSTDCVRLCRKTRSGFKRPFFRLPASGCIDDRTNIACFAVFARQKNARPRADDGVFRQSLAGMPLTLRSERCAASRSGDSLCQDCYRHANLRREPKILDNFPKNLKPRGKSSDNYNNDGIRTWM